MATRLATHSGAGFTLTELLITLAINLFLVAGSVVVFMKARDLQRAVDANARLQETARYALAVIEADLRMAGFWGLAGHADAITTNAALAFPARCGGLSWLTGFARIVDGTNNGYLTQSNCAALSGGAQGGSDVLVLHRASAQSIPLAGTSVNAANRDRVLVISRPGSGQIFLPSTTGGAIPAGYPVGPGEVSRDQLRSLLVHAYYVSADSSSGRGVPALRRKTLTSGPNVGDEEIAAGVEDLQVRVGMDTDDDGNADTYVNPGQWPPGAAPVVVQLWLRVRSQERDAALGELASISYADRTWPATSDGYRRVLVASTIQLRNTYR
jgi:type IV pilus assembly protein PilW